MVAVRDTLGSSIALPAPTPRAAEPCVAETSGGQRIAFYVQPNPPPTTPLIAIAGGPGADHRYLRIGGAFDAIARDRRLVYYDQRGSGRSSSDGPDVRIADFVEDLDAVRDALGAGSIDLIGHSFGGYLAMAYAAKHGSRVRSLVLVGSQAPKLSETPELLEHIFPDRVESWRDARSALPPRFPARELGPYHAMAFLSPQAHAQYVRAIEPLAYNIRVNDALRRDMERLDFRHDLRAFRMPTLVLHGRWDAVIAPSCGFGIHRLIAGSRFHAFERSGHSPFVEEPEAFARLTLDFLSDVDSGNAGRP